LRSGRDAAGSVIFVEADAARGRDSYDDVQSMSRRSKFTEELAECFQALEGVQSAEEAPRKVPSQADMVIPSVCGISFSKRQPVEKNRGVAQFKDLCPEVGFGEIAFDLFDGRLGGRISGVPS
jgi:hypothetical protein